MLGPAVRPMKRSFRGQVSIHVRPTALLAPLAFVPLLLGALSAQAQPDEATGKLFFSRCTACHTVGEGVRVGPDLLGVTTRRTPEWIRTFLKSPAAALAAKDPIALELLAKHKIQMPEQNLAPAEIDGLLAWFAACTVKGGCKPNLARLGMDGTPEEIALGELLFTGKSTLAQGGPACVACHTVRGLPLAGGGTLGPDLTFAMARLTDQGVSEKMLASPLERHVYAGHELIDAEKLALRAYLAQLSRDGTWSPADTHFFPLGLLGACALFGALGIVWVAGRGRPKEGA